MKRGKVVILGAGLAGLSTAYHLEKFNHGNNYKIFEKEDAPGGLCRSKKVNGFTFDYDGHLLHFKRDSILSLVKELMSDNLVGHQRNSWVYFSGSYIPYPFQANLFGLPSTATKECLRGFIEVTNKKHLHPSANNGGSFQDWLFQTFGEGIAKYFMVPYNHKFWTVPLKGLTCEWIDSFIPTPSLEEVIEGAITDTKRKYGYNALFWYPREGGVQNIASAFSKKIKKVETLSEATKIDLANRAITFKNGRKVKYKKLISTIPLPEIAKLIDNLPEQITKASRNLKWTSIFNLNLGIDRRDLSDKHWIYFPDKELSFFRVGFPHNFSSSLTPADKMSLYIEASYSQSRPLEKKTIVQRIIGDLVKTGILFEKDKIIAQDINDIKYAYIIYNFNYADTRSRILKFLSKNNIFSIGRYGAWRYMSMEEAILEGERIAKEMRND